MLKSLRFQLMVRKNKPSRTWYEGSVEDEEEEKEEDEDFHVVEVEDDQVDRQSLDSACSAWEVSPTLGLEEINLNLLCDLKLSEPSKLLSLSQIQQLSQHFPDMLSVCNWMLIYETQTHGSSLSTLYRMAEQLDHCMVLMIQDSFGQVYKWTGDNSYFIKGSVDSLHFGGGRGRFGLWLNSDLIRGRSQNCDTFDNDILSTEEDFMINEIEVWALV